MILIIMKRKEAEKSVEIRTEAHRSTRNMYHTDHGGKKSRVCCVCNVPLRMTNY